MSQAGVSSEGIPPSIPVEVDRSKHPSGIVPTLQNVVATSYLGRRLDLKHIAMHARNAEYNPKRFAAVIMRIREPKTTALVFSSGLVMSNKRRGLMFHCLGKMVCTGAKSEQDARLASRKFARIIQKLGFDDAKFKDFMVQNIVGSCDVGFQIRLEGLHYKHSLFSSYEPELFPGLIYRMKVPKVVLLIFVSGKVVLTGAKTRDQIYSAFENIYPALVEYRKGELPPGLDSNSTSKKRTVTHREDQSEMKSFHSIMSNINTLQSVDSMSNARLIQSMTQDRLTSDVTGGKKRARLDSGLSTSVLRGESGETRSHLMGSTSIDHPNHSTAHWRTQLPPSTPRVPNPTSSP